MSGGDFTSHGYTNYIVTGGIRMVTINNALVIKIFFRQQQIAAGLRIVDYRQEETQKQNIPGTKIKFCLLTRRRLSLTLSRPKICILLINIFVQNLHIPYFFLL